MSRVYFIRRRDKKGPVLIISGCSSTNVLEHVQVGNPEPLTVFGSVDAASYPESWWHEQFNIWRIQGGWYQKKPQVLCLIEDAVAGQLPSPLELSEQPEPPEPTSKVPDDWKPPSPEELAKAKWAFPKIDPLAPIPQEKAQSSQVNATLRKLLKSSSTAA